MAALPLRQVALCPEAMLPSCSGFEVGRAPCRPGNGSHAPAGRCTLRDWQRTDGGGRLPSDGLHRRAKGIVDGLGTSLRIRRVGRGSSSHRTAAVRMPRSKFSTLSHSSGAWAFSPGQAEAHEEHRGAEEALEVADDGDRAAVADDHRLAAERRQRGPGPRRRRAGPSRLGAPGRAADEERDLDAARPPARRAPRGRGTAGRSRRGPGRGRGGSSPWPWRCAGMHGLRPVARVAAQQAVDLAGRPRPEPLERRVARLAAERRRARFLPEAPPRRTGGPRSARGPRPASRATWS